MICSPVCLGRAVGLVATDRDRLGPEAVWQVEVQREVLEEETEEGSILRLRTPMLRTLRHTRPSTLARAGVEPVLVVLVVGAAVQEAQKAQIGWIFYRARRLRLAWAPLLLPRLVLAVQG